MVVYLSEYIYPKAAELLRQQATVVDTFDNIEEIDAIIVRGASVTAEMMDRAKKLKVIAKHGIGCNSIDVEAAKQRGIQVIYTPTANADSVAELTVALFLLLQRRLYEANEGCRAGRFTSIAPRDFLGTEILGKTFGQIGMGNIAQRIAHIMHNGFGVKVLGYDPFIDAEEAARRGFEKVDTMKLFDCTLRDGANVVGNGFSPELTESMVKNLLRCGIQDIELGNAKGIGSYDAGATAPLDDEGYMRLVEPYTEQGRLGMFLLAAKATPQRVALAAAHKLSFLRVGIAAGDGRKAIDAVHMVKDAGLTCRYSLMKAYICTAEELADEAAMLAAEGVDRITIMDSAGTMFPDEVSAYVTAMRKKVSIPVGFHGHSNLGLSQANALAAVAVGAEEVDCGLLGMARSAGNCSTEVAAATFLREGLLGGVDFYGLLSYLDNELIPAMQPYGYRPAVLPEDLILGLSGCHSSFLKLFHQIAQEESVPVYQLIVEVSKTDRKAPGEELIRRTAQALKHTQTA